MTRVPLIRTDGKEFGDETTLTPGRMLRAPVLLRASKTEKTRQAEQVLSLGDCLYFYVGYPCPEFGQIVLVYEPSLTDGSPGSATPFDTGGLCGGHVHADGVHDEATRQAYLQQHKLDLTDWQDHFGLYVERHFTSEQSYVRGERARADDPSHRLFHADNERRAWTWEIQLHRDHPLLDGLKLLCASSDLAERMRRELLKLSEDEVRPWDDLLDSPRFCAAPADAEAPVVCHIAQERICSWL